MANAIQLSSGGVTYDIKDATGRQRLEKVDVYARENIPWKNVRENLTVEVLEGKYPGGGIGAKIAFGTASGYNCAKVALPKSKRIVVEGRGSNNFFRLTDYDDIVIAASYTDYAIDVGGLEVFQFPANAAYAYLSSSAMPTTFVAYEGDDYATSNRGRVEIPDLVVGGVYAENANRYQSLNGANYNLSVTGFENTQKFGSATLDYTFHTITVTGQNGGAYFPKTLTAYNRMIRLRIDCTFTTSTLTCQMHYIRQSDSRNMYVNLGNLTSGINEFDFDAAFYNVYMDSAGEYQFLVQCNDTNASGVVTVNSIDLYIMDAFNSSAYYNTAFPQMMMNVFEGIDEAKQGEQLQNILVAPNGSKYVMGVNNNGEVVLIPILPSKTLFCGNSLLLGMNTGSSNHQYVYGMCATQPSNDYCHIVMNAIVAKKPSAIYDRVHGAAFEQLGTSDSFSTLWNTTPNVYTGQPLKNSFTNDLDLIVIQLGDNVNDANKRQAFSNNINTFISNIRTASPNARILWVFGWFNNAEVQHTIETACKSWCISTLNIQRLNIESNQGHSGQTYIDGDGNTQTVSDRWITHPGDNGFVAISNAMIDALGI